MPGVKAENLRQLARIVRTESKVSETTNTIEGGGDKTEGDLRRGERRSDSGANREAARDLLPAQGRHDRPLGRCQELETALQTRINESSAD